MDRTPTQGSWSWWTKAKRAASELDDETWKRGGVSPTLNAMDNSGDTRATVVLAFDAKQDAATAGRDTMPSVAYDEFNDTVSDTHHTLRSGTRQSTGTVTASQVRRLTPRECERLQGFPDDWTDGQADSARYKQMGNAVAVPVVEWIMRRLVQADGEDS